MAASPQAPMFRTVSNSTIVSDTSGNDVRSRSRPASLRVSMEEYYHSQLANPTRRLSTASVGDNFDDPPTYDVAVNGLHLPATRLKIQPREDEGNEQLPAYSCSIMLRAVLSKKMELETAVHRAFDRNWYKVYVELQGTALRLYKTKSAGLFADGGGPNHSADLPPYLKPGELLKIYSLQHADVGIAADYSKRPYVIRVRVETDQFLLSCVEIETFLLWVESLTAAIDLAPPLDERKLPRDTSMPFRNRRRRRAAETIPEETVVPPYTAEVLLDPTPNERDGANSTRPSTGTESVALEDMLMSSPGPHNEPFSSRSSIETITHDTLSLTHAAQPSGPPSLAQPPALASPFVPRPLRPFRFPPTPNRISLALTASNVSNSQPNPNITSDGKWRPHHDWSPRYDMIYAKRCMAILLSNTPRKTNLVIMRGKQWIVDWATGALTRWEPPAYDPPVYTELVGPWGVLGAGGTFLRA